MAATDQPLVLKARLLQCAFDAGVGLPFLRWGSLQADGSDAIKTVSKLASQDLKIRQMRERTGAA